MKLLLPVYSENDAQLIVDFVKRHQWKDGAEINVLHVLGPSISQDGAKTAEKLARELLDKVSAQVQDSLASAKLSQTVKFGSPTLEIIECANQWHADAIVMGYRSEGSIDAALAGSVAKGVAMQAPCTVTIIRPS